MDGLVRRGRKLAEARRVVDELMQLSTADETDQWLADYVAARKEARENGEGDQNNDDNEVKPS